MRNDIGECVSVRRVFTLENCDISMFLLAIFVCCSCQLVDFECILYSALCSSFFPLLVSRMDVPEFSGAAQGTWCIWKASSLLQGKSWG